MSKKIAARILRAMASTTRQHGYRVFDAWAIEAMSGTTKEWMGRGRSYLSSRGFIRAVDGGWRLTEAGKAKDADGGVKASDPKPLD